MPVLSPRKNASIFYFESSFLYFSFGPPRLVTLKNKITRFLIVKVTGSRFHLPLHYSSLFTILFLIMVKFNYGAHN